MTRDAEKLKMLQGLVDAWFSTLREASADYSKGHHTETLRYAAIEVNQILRAASPSPAAGPPECMVRIKPPCGVCAECLSGYWAACSTVAPAAAGVQAEGEKHRRWCAINGPSQVCNCGLAKPVGGGT